MKSTCTSLLLLSSLSFAQNTHSQTYNAADSAALSDTIARQTVNDIYSIGSETESNLWEHSLHVTDSRIYKLTSASLPIIAGGLIMKTQDKKLHSLRNSWIPSFHFTADDYLQYSPAVVMLGMKAAGVEGRSSWGRMLLSDAFSVTIMATLVNSIKHTAKVERPNGSNNHSFPSGHTATAFMTASMLSHEYGYVSPWISAGAYTVATATGIMRMANNSHWLSDVMVGAGIGIMSTELGYFIADLICKNEGLTKNGQTKTKEWNKKPSFVSLYVGVNIPVSQYTANHNTYDMTSGSTMGLEGAWFLTPNLGIGGRVSISDTYLNIVDSKVKDKSFRSASMNFGGFGSLNITQRWLLGGKLLLGGVYYPELRMTDLYVAGHYGAAANTGVSCTYRYSRNYGMKLFLDYDLQSLHNITGSKYISQFSTGLSFSVML